MRTSNPSSLPGWYADPWQIASFRWWDGTAWSGWASGPPPPTPREDPPSATFAPWAAFAVALATVGTISFARAVETALHDYQPALATAVLYAILFAGMAGSCVIVSKVGGTGSIVRDFGWRIRTIDVAWGLVALVASTVVRVAFALIVRPERQDFDDVRSNLERDNGVLAVFLIAALIGAPLVEELVFRGVMQRGLTRLSGKYVAIAVQGLLFGFYHVVGAFDLASVFYVGSLSLIGMVLGVAADRTGRLGPGIIAHFLSNALALAVLLA